MVVDDSDLIRRMLKDCLESDSEIRVSGSARHGKAALQLLDAAEFDLMVLDVEMPVLDGLDVLRELRQRRSNLPVVMFSTMTERGALATLEALALGARDYVTKPLARGGPEAARQYVIRELLPRVRTLSGRSAQPSVATPELRATAQTPRPALPRRERPRQPRAISIAASTGGPAALEQLLTALPQGLCVPLLIVQHMPPLFTRLLAERLDQRCALRIVEGTEGLEVEAGCAYIAPGGHHMLVEAAGTQVRLRLNQDPPENSCRPAADVLFRSVAQVYGGASLAVVMTGMGSDGTKGCGVLRAAGAAVLAQDEASSVVWGMAGLVARAGLADTVLPLDALAGELVLRVGAGSVRPRD